jgi:Uma2 family endonuclease
VDRLYRISVAQYFEMAQTGILTKSDRVVLLEGLLVAKMTKHPPHILATKLTIDALRASVPLGWHVGQEASTATLDSVPEPDCTVIRGVARDYRDRWAGPQDVALVVEVADSSLKLDQTVMRIIYARAAIPVYWIVNIPDRRLEVYSDPTGPTESPDYRQRRDYGPDDDVPLVLDGREVGRIAVRDLLP